MDHLQKVKRLACQFWECAQGAIFGEFAPQPFLVKVNFRETWIRSTRIVTSYPYYENRPSLMVILTQLKRSKNQCSTKCSSLSVFDPNYQCSSYVVNGMRPFHVESPPIMRPFKHKKTSTFLKKVLVKNCRSRFCR